MGFRGRIRVLVIRMKKKLIFGISILSVFLLCSLSYNPIIAENQIDDVKESYISVNKITKLNNLYVRLAKMRFESDNDCECNNYDFIDMICIFLWVTASILRDISFYISDNLPSVIGLILVPMILLFAYPILGTYFLIGCDLYPF